MTLRLKHVEIHQNNDKYTFKISLHCVFLRSMAFLAGDNTALSRKKAAGKIYKNQLNFQTSTFIYQCSDSPNFLFYGDSCWSIKVVLYNYLSDGFFLLHNWAKVFHIGHKREPNVDQAHYSTHCGSTSTLTAK